MVPGFRGSYGLNCVSPPPNSYVEVLTPSTSEYGYILR